MAIFNIPDIYILQWETWSGTEVLGQVQYQSESLSCSDIQISLEDIKAPDSYPVDCNFENLNWTWVVLFMDPLNQQLVESIEVNTLWTNGTWFTMQDLEFIYLVEFILIILSIYSYLLIRLTKRIFPNFKKSW